MSQDNSTSKGSIWPGIIIGAVLMFGGAFMDRSLHLTDEEYKTKVAAAAQEAKESGKPAEPVGHWKVDQLNTLDEQGLPINPGISIATIGVLLITFPLIRVFYTDPLKQSIDERNGNLEATFSEVESLRNEMASMKSDYEKKLAASEADAREKINAQIKEAQALRQSLMAEAASKSDALLKQAQEEIAGEKAKALRDIQVHVTDLALLAAEKVVGKNMDNETNRKLVADFVNDLEVAN
ncbi:MAG: F0F1 ATP synthase subunit B [Armatimonadetes bacterium]|nr:F0F1 ATP synthase subunit B [Armatimonadota bacterium]